MRIVCISDTHGTHGALAMPPGDLLLHAGDFTCLGHQTEDYARFAQWFAAQPYPAKLVIAGNHEFLLDEVPEVARKLLDGCAYLENETVRIDGMVIHGAPQQPAFGDMAFNVHSQAELATVWACIPDDVEVLVTHGPPLGVLDRTHRGVKAGCAALAQRLKQLPRLRLHVFGHIHEGAGTFTDARGVLHVNAAMVDRDNQLVHEPIVVETNADGPWRVVPP